MPKYILKIHDEKFSKDYYMEWSTVVDAPITYGLPLEAFKDYYKDEYGADGMEKLDERLKRVEEKGVSAYPPFDKLESYFSYNRAGENETTIGKEEILERYCRNYEG